MKYETKVFEIDGKPCHWQLMFSSDGIVCCRFVQDGFGMKDKERRKYEKRIRVPRPKFSKKENLLLNEVFKTFNADENTREAIINALIWKKWMSVGKKKVERLAKADYERWIAAKGKNQS